MNGLLHRKWPSSSRQKQEAVQSSQRGEGLRFPLSPSSCCFHAFFFPCLGNYGIVCIRVCYDNNTWKCFDIRKFSCYFNEIIVVGFSLLHAMMPHAGVFLYSVLYLYLYLYISIYIYIYIYRYIYIYVYMMPTNQCIRSHIES